MSEMIEKKNEERGLATNVAPPAGMPLGMELNSSEFESPSFTKIIQSQTGQPFKPTYSDGDLVIVPDMERVIEMGDKFHFAVVFFYPEFLIYNPRDIPNLPFIRERTFDPNSEIAQKAQSRDEDINCFVCPEDPKGKEECRYVTHQCYVIVLLDHNDAIGISPIVHSFSRGEAVRGQKFRKLIKARRLNAVYEARFQGSVSLRNGPKGSWYGLDVSLPDDGNCLVDKDMLPILDGMYRDCAKTFAECGILVDYEAGADTIDGSVVTDANEKF